LGGDTQPTVYIVIPVHDRRTLTLRCLDSLKVQSYPKVVVVVVDDGSVDGTSSAVEQLFPDVVLLRGTGDLWWSGATNAGVSWALQRCQPYDFVLTLNDDTIVNDDYLSILVAIAISLAPCLLGSVCVDSRDPNRIVDGGPMVSWVTAKTTSRYSNMGLAELRSAGVSTAEAMFLPGRGTLIPVECFRTCGLFNARRLPQYGADYEFSRRAARAGYRLFMCYESPVINQITPRGAAERERREPWADFVAQFFSRKSPSCLLYRWRFARMTAPLWLLAPFLVTDTLRVVGGGLRNRMRNRDS
jgi:GT2 family glycosyltransferase